MKYKVSIGSRYTVTPGTADCVVKDSTGRIVATVKPGAQYTFTAATATVELSDASAALTANFNSAPAAGGAGGISEDDIIDAGFVKNTAAGPSSIAIGGDAQAREPDSVAIGRGADASDCAGVAVGYGSRSGYSGVAIGGDAKNKSGSYYAVSIGTCSGTVSSGVAVGFQAHAGEGIALGAEAYSSNGVALGRAAFANVDSLALGKAATAENGATAIGPNAQNCDVGTLALCASYGGVRTQLYLIAAGSPQAHVYTQGKAALGYCVFDSYGNINASGIVSLQSIAPGSFLPTFGGGSDCCGSDCCGCGC